MLSGAEDTEAHGWMCGSTNGTYLMLCWIYIIIGEGISFFPLLFLFWYYCWQLFCLALKFRENSCMNSFVSGDRPLVFVFIVERQKDPIKYCIELQIQSRYNFVSRFHVSQLPTLMKITKSEKVFCIFYCFPFLSCVSVVFLSLKSTVANYQKLNKR